MDASVVPCRYRWSDLVPARRDIGVRTGKDRQRLTRPVEIGALRVGARDMALHIKLAVAALDQKRDLAGDQPRAPLRHEQPEIVPLDMRDENLLARFGKGRRQIDHRATSRLRISGGVQLKCW